MGEDKPDEKSPPPPTAKKKEVAELQMAQPREGACLAPALHSSLRHLLPGKSDWICVHVDAAGSRSAELGARF